MRDVPYSKVIKEIRKKGKTFRDALGYSNSVRCKICGNKLSDLGLSRVKGVCCVCAEMSLS